MAEVDYHLITLTHTHTDTHTAVNHYLSAVQRSVDGTTVCEPLRSTATTKATVALFKEWRPSFNTATVQVTTDGHSS